MARRRFGEAVPRHGPEVGLGLSRTRILTIFRGLPGAGKSTEARKLGCPIIEPHDHWAYQDGVYTFTEETASQLRPIALRKALIVLETYCRLGYDVAITEVFSALSDMVPYIRRVLKWSYEVRVIDMKVDVKTALSRNLHEVPLDVLHRMEDSWEDYPGDTFLATVKAKVGG